MPAIQITYPRALKIWWSFAWRAFVLLIPVMFALDVAIFFFLPLPKSAQSLPPDQIPGFMLLRGFIVFIVLIAANILLQAQAMRWMLRTRWAGFRLQAISEE